MIRETMRQRRRAPDRAAQRRARTRDELGYRDELEAWQADPAYRLTYVPTVSRPSDPRNAGWTGRDGRAEQVIGDVCRDLGLRPE